MPAEPPIEGQPAPSTLVRSSTILSPQTACALVWKDERITYTELLARARRCSRRLPGKGVRVVVFGENSPAWVIAAYALWCSGATLVPVDHLSTPEELAYILDDCSPQLVLCSRNLLATTETSLGRARHRPTLALLEDLELESLSPTDANEVSPLEVAESQLATIVYTSGTTGEPKGVMLSFGNLLANIRAVVKEGYFTPDARVLLLLPLHHVLPLAGSLLAPLFAGSTVVFAPSLAGEELVATLCRHAITTIVGVPRFYDVLHRALRERIDRTRIGRALYKIARTLRSHAFSRLVFGAVHRKFGGAIQHLICGGAALGSDTAETFDVLGFKICQGYGMTECAPMITFPRLQRLKLGSCGQVLDGCEATTTPDGEVIVRGPNVMLGYYNRPAETQAILRDGWLHTGDLGHFDADGYLYITGRQKETIVLSSGKKLNPTTIEANIETTTPVVRELGVFLDGDALHALVLPNWEQLPASERDRAETYLRGAVLEPYNAKVAPYRRLTKLTIAKEPLPRTRLGKLRRHQLPELARRHATDTNAASALHETPNGALAPLLGFLHRQLRQEVHPSSRLSADLGLDSLARVELVVFIQRHFGVDLPETRLSNVETVIDLARLIDDSPHAFASDSSSAGDVSWSELLHPRVPPPMPRSSVYHGLIIHLSRLWVRIHFRVDVQHESTGLDEPFILVANHQSYFDGLFVTAFLRPDVVRRTLFYAKERHVRQAWARFLAGRCNTIVVDPRRGYLTSLQQLAAGLGEGKNVIIFPEGTRSRDGALGVFKDSYAILARELRVSVVPVVIDGAHAAMPERQRLPTFGAPIRLRYLAPVRVASDEDPAAFNARVRSLLEAALERLRTGSGAEI